MTSTERGVRDGLEWPVPPEIAEPVPPDTRRAWGKVSYEQRYRRQRLDLLRAAARVGAARGFASARIADIVAEAGLSKGTFYEHFESKEHCFLELHRRTNASMIRAGIRAAEASFADGPYETVLAVCRALTGYVARDPALARALGGIGATHDEMRDENARNRERIVDLFAVIARRHRSSLPPGDLELAARILVTGVTALLPELRRRGRGQEGFDDELRAIARIGCRGLGLSFDGSS